MCFLSIISSFISISLVGDKLKLFVKEHWKIVKLNTICQQYFVSGLVLGIILYLPKAIKTPITAVIPMISIDMSLDFSSLASDK